MSEPAPAAVTDSAMEVSGRAVGWVYVAASSIEMAASAGVLSRSHGRQLSVPFFSPPESIC